ncbi:MAG: LodA/GoxA family CTQ-dependent oxidase [Acetobacteraceae bacterium]|nr:LodA/GoxA family CTQ-dependent oxidase [Acetobacteraceae bacterium]
MSGGQTAESKSIVRAAIHPSIGIARVGTAAHEYSLAPEVPDPPAEKPGFYRDSTGALKRQAARFRIYGLNAEGTAVAEVTTNNAEIHWTVHLANKKAAWYQFQIALDIPEAASAPPSRLRNSTIADRQRLIIDPGARRITGRNSSGPHYRFDTGRFMDKPVYLGELRTDADGRLIVLGGHGKSASYNRAMAVTFANNEGWHDDVSDGPVTAEVTFEGKRLPVDPAWVVVAPPNYAPLQKSVRTMWDVIRDVLIGSGMLPKPARPAFQKDIRPIFERLSALQWVNAGFAAAFGWGAPNNLAAADWLERLSRPDPSLAEMRRVIANQFRVFDRDAWSPVPWPWLYGDAMNIPPPETPRQNTTLTDTQLHFLQQWAAGDFDADYDPHAQPPRSLEAVTVAQQPDTLDRASLEFCLADAFHPGCEMTWPMRTAGIYMAPFRLAHAAPGWIEPDYGPVLGAETIGLPNGPLLGGQLPGGVSRWMAVPWQTDTASCRSGYLPSYDPNVPTFWPARVPNQVLTSQDYQIVMDEERPLAERLAAFARRASWLQPLGDKSYTDQINNMIAHFDHMGVVEQRDGPKSGPFPPEMQVQQLPAQAAAAALTGREPERLDLSGIEKVRRFPHGLRR